LRSWLDWRRRSWTTSLRSMKSWSFEGISAWLWRSFQPICMIWLKRAALMGSIWKWYEKYRFKFFMHWKTWNHMISYIVIWSLKTSCFETRTDVESSLLILAPPAISARPFTHTFNLDSTEHLKLYWEFLMGLQLIFGVLDASWLSSTMGFPYLLETMNRNRLL